MRLYRLFPLLMTLAVALDPCQMHVAHLMQLYALDRPQCSTFSMVVLKEVAGYVLFSGKMVNDLGLPESCLKNDNYRYFTAHS
jgi:hypothetical protein